MNSQAREDWRVEHCQLNALFQNDKHHFSYFFARTNHIVIPNVIGMESIEEN